MSKSTSKSIENSSSESHISSNSKLFAYETLAHGMGGRIIKALTPHQQEMVECIDKKVITGDITQIDLVFLTIEDVVRHKLVAKIIQAYEIK